VLRAQILAAEGAPAHPGDVVPIAFIPRSCLRTSCASKCIWMQLLLDPCCAAALDQLLAWNQVCAATAGVISVRHSF
jgi:hypothetical protein